MISQQKFEVFPFSVQAVKEIAEKLILLAPNCMKSYWLSVQTQPK